MWCAQDTPRSWSSALSGGELEEGNEEGGRGGGWECSRVEVDGGVPHAARDRPVHHMPHPTLHVPMVARPAHNGIIMFSCHSWLLDRVQPSVKLWLEPHNAGTLERSEVQPRASSSSSIVAAWRTARVRG